MCDAHNGPGSFVLREDNCGRNRANYISFYLANKKVTPMKRPAEIPALNAIENVWRLIKGCLSKRTVHSKNDMDLFLILSQIRNSLPDSYFADIVASKQKRVAMEVAASCKIFQY